MDNLRSKILSGLFWNMSERVGIYVVQFIPTIVLARLLAPEQFGLIGMLSLFIAVANVFLDSGFGAALIQKKDATYIDECSIFYFNIFIGGTSVLVLFYAAPLIANFYNQPVIADLTRFISIGILINAFGLIQTTLLTRKLDFKAQFKAGVIGVATSGVIGVAAAYLGFGVWSLAIQTIANTLLRTVTLWLICDWRPAFVFSMNSLKGMFGFSSNMLMSNLVATFFDNLYQVFIGKVFSATSLGYFTRASSMKSIVVDTTCSTMGRVLYPALASIQDDLARLKRAYRHAIMLCTFIHFPLMIGLIVVARPLVTLLFSAKWESCVVFFQLMCAAGLLYPLQLINLDILKVKGRSDLFFRLGVLKQSLIVISIFITYRWGISAMLIGQIVLTVFGYLLNSYYSEKLIGYPMKTQVLDMLPSFVFSCLMGSGMLLVGNVIKPASNFVLLVAQTGVGIIIYFLLHLAITPELLFDFIGLTKQIPILMTDIEPEDTRIC